MLSSEGYPILFFVSLFLSENYEEAAAAFGKFMDVFMEYFKKSTLHELQSIKYLFVVC